MKIKDKMNYFGHIFLMEKAVIMIKRKSRYQFRFEDSKKNDHMNEFKAEGFI